MRLHNFIVDFREETKVTSLVDEIDKEVFDEDCRRFLAVHPEIDNGGVHGGEDDDKLDKNGNVLLSGRPKKGESDCAEHGKKLRKTLCNDIAERKLVRPKTNWYQENNRVLEG